MPRPNIDPAPLSCRCGCDAFQTLTRVDRIQSGDMGLRGTPWKKLIQCANCSQTYGFPVDHPHRDGTWTPVQVGVPMS